MQWVDTLGTAIDGLYCMQWCERCVSARVGYYFRNFYNVGIKEDITIVIFLSLAIYEDIKIWVQFSRIRKSTVNVDYNKQFKHFHPHNILKSFTIIFLEKCYTCRCRTKWISKDWYTYIQTSIDKGSHLKPLLKTWVK